MSWAVGFDLHWNRDIGYGVPATCDSPSCGVAIDRGLGYVCGGEPYGGKHGCGLFFCDEHLLLGGPSQRCQRCVNGRPSYDPTPDTDEWINWKLTDESWSTWRDENPDAVALMTGSR